MRPTIRNPNETAAGAATPATARCKSLMALLIPQPAAAINSDKNGSGNVRTPILVVG